MSNGAALLASSKARVAADGQTLTISRPAAVQGADPTTYPVGFLPQALIKERAGGLGDLSVEAGGNVNQGNSHDFVTPGDSDVIENDLILYDGYKWRVYLVTGVPVGGIKPWLHCHALRETKIV